MSVAASPFPVTVTPLATFTAFTMMISRRGVVPMALLVVVAGPGIISISIYFGLVMGVLFVNGKIWIRMPIHIEMPPSVTRTLVPRSIAVARSPMMVSPTVALAPTPRDSRV